MKKMFDKRFSFYLVVDSLFVSLVFVFYCFYESNKNLGLQIAFFILLPISVIFRYLFFMPKAGVLNIKNSTLFLKDSILLVFFAFIFGILYSLFNWLHLYAEIEVSANIAFTIYCLIIVVSNFVTIKK